MTVTSNTGTAATGTSTAPSVTVPAGVTLGDVLVVHIGFNNTNLITGRPTGLTQIGTNPFAGATQGTSEIYWGVVDGSTIAAGTALSWALSGTRQWSISLEAYSGVDNTNPIHQNNLVARTSTTTTHTSPTITTTVTSHVLELFYGKPTSGTLTSATPPAGYSTLQSIFPASSFSAAVAQAAQATDQAAGSYGGDNWTASVSTNPEAIYTLALLPAATAPHAGSAAGAVTFTGAVAGLRIAQGSGAGTVHFTGAAAGTTSRGGTAAGTVRYTGSGTGLRQPVATAAGVLAFSGAAAGTAPTVGGKFGTAAGALHLTGSATGATTRQGSAAGVLSLAGAAAGQAARNGSATGTLVFAGAAVGTSQDAADITVTANLAPPSWSASLTARTRTAVLDTQGWGARLE